MSSTIVTPVPFARRRLRRRALFATASALLVCGTATVVAAAPSTQDTNWMVSAHQSNLAEIAAGTSAQSRATTDEVRQLGAMFVEMHTQLDADLTAAAATLGVQLPPAPTPDQQAQLAAVEANAGSAYDTAWIAQQLASHELTLQAGQTEISSGSDPTVVGLAQAAAPVVQQHLTELQNLSTASEAPTRVDTGSGGDAATAATSWTSWTSVSLMTVGAALLLAAALLVGRSRRRAA